MSDPQIERWVRLGERQLRTGQAHAAIDSLRRALAEDPDHADAHALMAFALFDAQRIHAAKHEAAAAVALAPESGLAHHALGLVMLGHRDLDRAEHHLVRAVDFDPHHAEPRLAMAALRRQQGLRDEALKELEAAREIDPNHPDALVDLGDLRLEMGDIDVADTLAREVLEMWPEQRPALILAGHVALRRGDVEKAREHAMWALRQDATDVDALRLLASIKARDSLLLGLWWRYHVWIGALGEGRSLAVLLGAFVLYRVLGLGLEDLGLDWLAATLRIAWLGLCAYSWVGPSMFDKALREELGEVQLADDF